MRLIQSASRSLCSLLLNNNMSDVEKLLMQDGEREDTDTSEIDIRDPKNKAKKI